MGVQCNRVTRVVRMTLLTTERLFWLSVESTPAKPESAPGSDSDDPY